MIRPLAHSRRPSGAGRRPPFPLPALLLLPILVGGCGVSLPPLRFGLPGRHPGPHETSVQRDLRETREAGALAPREAYWPFHLAEIYVEADSTDRARRAIELALARDPDYAPALALRSSLDFRARRHEQAIGDLETALARPGAFPAGPPDELLEGLALHYDALGRDEDAEKLLARVTGRPKSKAAPALVYLTLRGATPEAAATIAEAAVRDEPGSAVNQNNAGIVRLRQGDARAALKAFEKAVNLDPALPGPYYNLAIVQKYYLFDDDEARRWFDLYWQRSQKDPDGLAAAFGKSKSDRKPLAGDED